MEQSALSSHVAKNSRDIVQLQKQMFRAEKQLGNYHVVMDGFDSRFLRVPLILSS
jgi:hypothetical protein